MGESKPPDSDSRLLILAFGLALAPRGAFHASQKFRPEHLACANLADPDPFSVRDRHQRHSGGDRPTRGLADPSLQVRVARGSPSVSASRRSAAAVATASRSPESSTSTFGRVTIQRHRSPDSSVNDEPKSGPTPSQGPIRA